MTQEFLFLFLFLSVSCKWQLFCGKRERRVETTCELFLSACIYLAVGGLPSHPES